MELKYLVLSDIHLGHNVNKSEYIEKNIIAYFQKYKSFLQDINVVFIAGDSFDRLLSTTGEDYIVGIRVLIWLYRWCSLHGVKFRILEGTPSHDWRQCRVLEEVFDKLGEGVDFKYVDELEVENIDGCRVLYVPDEWKSKSEETVTDIQKLLDGEEADICIMHGAFKYQLPIDLESSFKEEDMEKLVKHFIHVGHIHTFSTKGKIIAQGSFDRLRFGEEEDKGAVVARVTDKEKEYVFLSNVNSMIFKTIDLSKLAEEEDVGKVLTKELKKCRRGSCVRVIVNDKEKLLKSDKNIDKLYKELELKMLKIEIGKDKKLTLAESVTENNAIEAFAITHNNIVNLVKSELGNTDIALIDQERIMAKLDSIIDVLRK